MNFADIRIIYLKEIFIVLNIYNCITWIKIVKLLINHCFKTLIKDWNIRWYEFIKNLSNIGIFFFQIDKNNENQI